MSSTTDLRHPAPEGMQQVPLNEKGGYPLAPNTAATSGVTTPSRRPRSLLLLAFCFTTLGLPKLTVKLYLILRFLHSLSPLSSDNGPRLPSWDMLAGPGSAADFDVRNNGIKHLEFAEGDAGTNKFSKLYYYLVTRSIVSRWIIFIVPVLAVSLHLALSLRRQLVDLQRPLSSSAALDPGHRLPDRQRRAQGQSQRLGRQSSLGAFASSESVVSRIQAYHSGSLLCSGPFGSPSSGARGGVRPHPS